jgi:hypothetical protein
MKEKIQTLHPAKGKKNKSIPVEKYNIVKAGILDILQYSEATYTEIVQQLTQNLKNKFDDNLSWYAMTVKLDLEAKKIIERTKTRPQKYRITKANP